MDSTRFVRGFDHPDEVIEVEGVRSEIVSLGGLTFARNTHQPGWSWETHVKPVVGGEHCAIRHVGVCQGGGARVVLADGTQFALAAGDMFEIIPGHLAWVTSEIPFVTIEWTGVLSWLSPRATLQDRVLATLLFTDIVDSTGLARRLGDRAWHDLIAAHDDRARDTLARFGGKIHRFTGDGMLAVFDGASRAIRGAVALGKMAGGLEIAIRAGVHTGEVEVSGDEIHGVAIHEAARIMSLADAGEVLVSDTTRDLAKTDSDLDFFDRGDHELRGLAGSRRLYEATLG